MHLFPESHFNSQCVTITPSTTHERDSFLGAFSARTFYVGHQFDDGKFTIIQNAELSHAIGEFLAPFLAVAAADPAALSMSEWLNTVNAQLTDCLASDGAIAAHSLSPKEFYRSILSAMVACSRAIVEFNASGLSVIDHPIDLTTTIAPLAISVSDFMLQEEIDDITRMISIETNREKAVNVVKNVALDEIVPRIDRFLKQDNNPEIIASAVLSLFFRTIPEYVASAPDHKIDYTQIKFYLPRIKW